MSYQSVILADTPTGFWLLDEAAGTAAADASGNGHGGTYSGTAGTTYTFSQSPIPGDGAGRSVLFAGGRVDVPQGTNPWSITTSSDFAMEAWAKFTSTNTMVFMGAGTGGGYWIGAVAGKARFRVGSSSIDSNSTINDGAWHHVVGTRRSGTMYLYIDGAQQTATVADTTVVTVTNGIGLADFDSDSPSFPFSGTLDDPAFYANSLTGTQVTNHYNAGSSGAATTLALSGPTSGTVNVASTNFTVTPNGTVSSDTVTLHSSGAGTFSPTTLTFTSSSAAQTFTYTPTSTAGSPHAISITDSAGLTISGSPINYTVNPAAVNVPVTDTGFFFSPHNWFLSGSAYAQTNAPGAYFKLQFTAVATGTPTLNVDVSPLTGGTVPGASYPTIRYRLNNGTWTDHQLASTDTALSLGSLAAGTYTLICYVLNADQGQDRWTAPAEVVRITGATLPGGSTTSAPTVRSKRMLVYGDSITEGIYVTAASVPSGGDSTATFAVGLAAALGAEVGVVGYGRQGWTITGNGNVPTFPNAWNLYWSATSRLSGGLLSPAPDYIVVTHGTNDGLQGATDASVTTAVQNWIVSARAAAPNARIFIIVPFGAFKATAIQQGVTNAADAKTVFLNLGSELSAGLSGPQGTPTWRSPTDGIHPDTRSHGEAGSRLVQAIQQQLGGGSGPVPMIGSPFIRFKGAA